MPQGITGSLLSRTFLERRLSALVRTADIPSPPRARTILAEWWRRAKAGSGPATSVRALTDTMAAHLATSVGYALEGRGAVSDSLWLARLEHASGSVPAAIVGWSAPFGPARRDVTRAALAAGSRWAVLLNGPIVRIADLGPASSRRHLDFAMDLVTDHDDASWCLVAMLAALRTTHAGATCALDAIVDTADVEGRRLCAALRDGVVVALEQLCEALAGGARTPPSLAAAYDDAQTAVYRLLFLSFAEARRLVPSWHPVYGRAYTIAALRAEAEGRSTVGLWSAFRAMSRLAHEGCDVGDLHVPAWNGRLFAPGRAPGLELGRLDNERLASALEALSSTTVSGIRERVAYADLGVEELGGVYESLLDYEPAWDAVEGKTGARRRVVLARTARGRRKETGTFYTPVALTRYLVRQAIGPLVAGVSADTILSRRIVDPAMGSGAFLVAACRFMADAYEDALVRDGACAAGDIGDQDRATFRRLIAQRCLYGVDLNPAAVQLARVSLWLTTLAADRPLGFLDHRLRCGDSLVGATLADLLGNRPPSGSRRARGDRQLPLFDAGEWQAARRSVLPVRLGFEREPDDTAADVRRKESAFTALGAEEEPWRLVADLWCSRWAGASPVRDAEFEAVAQHLVAGTGPLAPSSAARVVTAARDSAKRSRYLHWPLEFPEVFCDEHGRERPDGGFDAVVGNPPWEMLRADEGRRADDRADRTLRFARDSGVYHARSHGHANEYQLFVERAVRLARPGGRFGLVLPHGFACDQGAAPLRHLLIDDCTTEALVGFENRRGVFPIHRGVRFLLVSGSRGGTTRELRCRFGLQDPESLDGLAERPPGEALPIAFTPALLERLSGPDLAIPDVRSPADLALAEKLCALHPRLPDAGGWDARFGRELNATDDREHFTAIGPGLPVIDGRHVSAYRVDVAASDRRLPRAAARRLLDEARTFGRARLAFRDVASATNRTTLIAALVPAGCVTTHTLFCLRTPLTMADQWLLCALLNSYVANFFVRLRVTSHVSLSIVQALPVPRPPAASPLGRALGAAARAAAAGDGAAAITAQSLAAVAYGLDAVELDVVLESFPLVDPGDRERVRVSFSRAGRP